MKTTFLLLLLWFGSCLQLNLRGDDQVTVGAGAKPGVSAAWEVYVAADAAAGGDGSKRAPFRTLNQARDRIRAARKVGSLKNGQAVTVQLAPGAYHLESTFELTTEDSGTADAPVVFRSQQAGTARISGGITLDPATFHAVSDPAVLSRLDASVRDQVVVCDLSAIVPDGFAPFKQAFRGVPVAPWLYVNRRPMTLARWPNVDASAEGWAEFSKAVDTGLPEPDSSDPTRRVARPGSFEFNDPRPARWDLDKGVWLLGYWTHDWYDEVIRVDSYDEAKQVISLAAPHSYGIMGGTWGAAKRRFFAFNSLEELDAPGEWYLDRGRGRLYYYPGGELDDAAIELATMGQPLVKMDRAKHVTLAGLAFECGHGDGIVLKNTEHVEIAGCVVANLAKSGISISGTENTVRSCDLYNLGTNGISLNGGDRKTLTGAKNLVVNTHIHHYGLFQRAYAPGIGVNGCGQIVRNNCIHDAPHNAVLYGGNEHLFEQNEIYRVVMETGDSGAFYSGRDWTSQGNVLRHNYIHDLGGGDATHVNTMGVYLDDCDSGDTIEGNVFFRAGRAIMIGGGRDNRVVNNLVLDCPIGLHFDSRGMTWKQWNNPQASGWNLEGKAKALNYTNPPWSERYPKLAAIMNDSPREPLNNRIRRNVFVDCGKQVCNFDANVKKLIDKLEIADNLVVNTTGATSGVAIAKNIKGFTNVAGTADRPVTIGFADPSAMKLTQLQDARLTKVLSTFERIPFDQIGLFQDNYRRNLPPRKPQRVRSE